MTGKNVLEINELNFETEVLQAKVPFFLDFGARWCGPCKALAPVLDKIADENVGKYKVGKIDRDESPGISATFAVRGAPTVIVFKAGKEAGRHLGLATRQKLLALVED
jgi:thioredoxin 1